MAKPHETLDQEALQKHPMVKELMAELQVIDDKVRIVDRFYEVMN